MPPTKETARSILDDVVDRLERLVEAARATGRGAALGEVRSLLDGAAAPRRRAGRPARAPAKRKAARRKSSGPRKNPWAGLTPEARLARVNAIRKGRGLPPKTEA